MVYLISSLMGSIMTFVADGPWHDAIRRRFFFEGFENKSPSVVFSVLTISIFSYQQKWRSIAFFSSVSYNVTAFRTVLAS